ncbi:MAG: hypothetical protein HC842_00085 [Cytophagales bacterium]|nr:hypothetical protein [Cytophagales bacterium]
MEEESNDMFEPLRLKLTRSSHSLRSHLSQAEEALPRLEKCWQLGKSYKLFENYYVLNIWYHRMSGKYSELQQFLEKTEKETKPNPIRFNQKRFQLAKVKNLFDLGLFAETIKYAELYVRDFDRFSDGWYEVMRYYFLAANFARKFELSRELLQRAFINQHFDHLPDKEKILWHLFKAYFQVVVDRSRSLEAINLPLSPESMDEGFVLSHLILQYLFYTSPRNESKINEVQLHIEDIKLRYFKNQFGTRTKTFIKLISKTTELSLEKEDELQSKTKYLSRKLMEASDRADIYSDLEIMPYELLWERLSEFA